MTEHPRHPRKYPARRWIPPLAIGLSILTAVAVWFAATTTQQQRRGRVRSEQVSGQRAAQPEGMEQPGLLQRGVNKNDATFTIELGTSNNQPAFDKTELDVKPGQVVSLTFRNTSDPKFHYVHNFALLSPSGREVLARTAFLKAGDSETIFFRAPDKPGDYPYICMYPGHHTTMQGIMRVK